MTRTEIKEKRDEKMKNEKKGEGNQGKKKEKMRKETKETRKEKGDKNETEIKKNRRRKQKQTINESIQPPKPNRNELNLYKKGEKEVDVCMYRAASIEGSKR